MAIYVLYRLFLGFIERGDFAFLDFFLLFFVSLIHRFFKLGNFFSQLFFLLFVPFAGRLLQRLDVSLK